VAVGQVEGVRETIKALRAVEPALAREAVKNIKAPAQPAAAALKSAAPAVPLSGVGYYGPTKVSVNYGGKPRGDVWPLVRIRLTGPGWTVAADMARKSAPGETFTQNLTRKYGAASRFAWPTVERFLPAVTASIVKAVADVERAANQELGVR